MTYFYPLQKTICTIALLLTLFTAANAQSCTPQGDQATYGTNNVWIGYVYQGTNFNTYYGYVNEGNVASANFDESFGGGEVFYSTNGCSLYTSGFSVRYMLTKTFADGNYSFIVGADDGYRLSIDGGATWLINNWGDHGYTETTQIVHLSGSYNLVLEYYEAYGDNRIAFACNAECVGNGDPSVYGANNIWRAYFYQGKNFDMYKGYKTIGSTYDPNFDLDFGGSNVTYATSNCSIVTENFSARFRMDVNLPSYTYIFTLGGDDGYRLSLDGGSTWVIDRWFDQGYSIASYTVTLSGPQKIVLEYYENGGANRFSYSINNSTLPVKLVSWSASLLAPGKAKLSWKTTDAVNFDHFILQRSTDGQHYESVQTIAATNSTSNATQSYSTTDNFSFSGVVYYRLAMVDKDGSINYSAVATLNSTTGTSSIKVYPTIVQNRTVNIESGNINNGTIELFDLNGRLLQTENYSGSGRKQLQLKGANAAGAYLLRIRTGNEILAKQTLIVQ
ncbi:MAG: T9SS type A sorting domain-containing protein [Chitinophagaceae bacterium]